MIRALAFCAFIATFGAPAAAQDRPPLPTTYPELLEVASNHVAALQAGHQAAWGLGTAERYDVDLELGVITFTTDSQVVARAPAQLLGTWNPVDETFLWGWDHPSAPQGTATATAAMRDHARTHGIAELSDRMTSCAFDDCYSMAATAILIGDLQGIYRFDAGGPWAYIGFGNVTLSNQ